MVHKLSSRPGSVTEVSDREVPDRLAGDIRVLIGQLNRHLREHGRIGDLSWSQVQVIGRLERDGPMTITELSHAEHVRSQSMGATVAALEAAGMIRGSAEQSAARPERRQLVWSITPRCREHIAASRSAREDWLTQTLRTALDAPERQQLAESIELLRRLLEY